MRPARRPGRLWQTPDFQGRVQDDCRELRPGCRRPVRPKAVPKVLRSPVTKFFKDCLTAEADSHPAVGLGTDFRLESKKLTGFALILDDHLLHLSAFARQNGSGAAHAQMGSFSRRRRNRV